MWNLSPKPQPRKNVTTVNEKLKKRLLEIEERIDARPLRERGLIFLAFIAIVSVLTVNLLFAPTNISKKKLEAQFKTKNQQTVQLERQIQVMLRGQNRDPDTVNRIKLKQLKAKIRNLDVTLQRFTKGLVSPREMARLVEQILLKNRRLKIIKLENLPATSLISTSTKQNNGKDPSTQGLIYKHGMRIQLEGRYVDIVKYLKSLEKMQWKVFWGEVTISSEDYPVSKLNLVIYTLSLQQGWIGV